MASGSITSDAFQNTRNDLSRLTVPQLKQVSKGDGIQVSGTKGALQERLKTRIEGYYRSNDIRGFDKIRNLISGATRSSTASSFGGYSSSPSRNLPNDQGLGAGSNRGPASYAQSSSNPYVAQVRLNFRESPFYEVERALTHVEQTRAGETSRGGFEFKIKLLPEIAARFSKDNAAHKEWKIMVFGAHEPVSSYVKLDIAFPNQTEMRVNGMEVRTNFRGLKNRVGSTRPADVTDLVRKIPNYENSVTATYPLQHKKYYFVVNLVRQTPCEALVRKLREGKSISKEQVVREMINKAQDTDLEATSTIMSLKCPLSTLRMKTPCRSSLCPHNQCFDALSFLQLQQQGPTWTCPVCNRVVTFEALQVDRYVDEILNLTPQSVEQISISPNGDWDVVEPGENRARPSHNYGSQDDLIEIPDVPGEKGSAGFAAAVTSFMSNTPIRSSREQSTASGPAHSSNGKRPHSAVIDLTLDSDDDEQEQPIREPKRLAIHPPPPTHHHSFNSSHTPFENHPQDDTRGMGIPRPIPGLPTNPEYNFGRR